LSFYHNHQIKPGGKMNRLGLTITVLFGILFNTNGQVPEKLIYLPDSLAGLKTANRIAVLPYPGEVYIGSTTGDGIVVIDARTGEKQARISLPAGISRMCYVPAESALYCAGNRSDTVYVISNHQIITRIPVGGRMEYLTYNTLRNKLYLSGRFSGGKVAVIDCNINEVASQLVMAGTTGASAHLCRFDRIFCYVQNQDGNKIAVINGQNDSIVDSIIIGNIAVEQMLVNPVANKLYTIAGQTGDILIIDLWTNEILKHWIIDKKPVALCLNPDRNKIYIAVQNDSAVMVIDGDLDSIINTIDFETEPVSIAYDPNQDLIYVSCFELPLAAINCANDSISWTMHYPGFGDSLYYSPELNLIYTVQTNNSGNGDVALINPQTRELISRVSLLFNPSWALFAPTPQKLYLSGEVAGSSKPLLIAIDGISSSIISHTVIPERPGFIAHNYQNNKLYVGGDSLLMVIDCVNDSVIRTIPKISGCQQPYSLFYNPIGNRIFAIASSDSVSVIDAGADTLIATIYAPSTQTFGFNPVRNRVYISGTEYLTIVDGTTGAVINQLPGNFGRNWCYVPERDWIIWARARTFWAIQGLSNVIDTTVTVNHTIDEIATNPLNGKIYVASELDGMIYVYSGNNLNRISYFPVPARPVRIEIDTITSLLYCQHAEGAVLSIIDTRNENLIATISSCFTPWSPVLNPFRMYFYTLDPDMTKLVVWNLPTPGVSEGSLPKGNSYRLSTIVHGHLNLPVISRAENGTAAKVCDITGRQLTNLQFGENDLRNLPAGVFFIILTPCPEFKTVHKFIKR